MGARGAHAAGPDAMWKFERSMDYYGRTPANVAPKFAAPVVGATEIRLSSACVVQFSRQEYAFPEVFQPLSKQGVTEEKLDTFLMKAFGLTLSKVATVYALAPSRGNCAGPVMEFFQVGDRLLIPVGSTFYTYARADAPNHGAATGEASRMYPAYRTSALPLDYDRYYSECTPKILGGKRRPQTTDRCAPDFFPYVADPKSNDPLMKLIGNHDYLKGGSEYAGGFSPPFQAKTAATFLVFPPMKEVTLVRVDDFEIVRNDKRDVMSGVYLSIVDGKVIDQIDGCQFNRDYACTLEGKVFARLTGSGKFQRL